MFYQHHSKKFLPCIWPKLSLIQFKTLTLCPNSIGPAEKFVSIFLISPLKSTEGLPRPSSSPGWTTQHTPFPHRRAAPGPDCLHDPYEETWLSWQLITMIFPLSSSFRFYRKIHVFLRNSQIFWELTGKLNLQFYCKGYMEGHIIPSASTKQIFVRLGEGKGFSFSNLPSYGIFFKKTKCQYEKQGLSFVVNLNFKRDRNLQDIISDFCPYEKVWTTALFLPLCLTAVSMPFLFSEMALWSDLSKDIRSSSLLV